MSRLKKDFRCDLTAIEAGRSPDNYIIVVRIAGDKWERLSFDSVGEQADALPGELHFRDDPAHPAYMPMTTLGQSYVLGDSVPGDTYLTIDPRTGHAFGGWHSASSSGTRTGHCTPL